MKRWIPRISTMPATGTSGTTIKVLVNMTKAAPETPLAPLEVSMATITNVSCCESDRSMFSACAIKRTAIVR
ncbi:hypothetical protein D9M71_611730 [compost metagenome]